MYPWICGRCAREFDHTNVQELTVHHRDHNHDNNPPDGSNWELLCLYCHDNEHQRSLDTRSLTPGRTDKNDQATHQPFADLASLLKKTTAKPALNASHGAADGWRTVPQGDWRVFRVARRAVRGTDAAPEPHGWVHASRRAMRNTRQSPTNRLS